MKSLTVDPWCIAVISMDGESADKISGAEILQHFEKLLQEVEKSLPHAPIPVERYQSPPSSVEALDALRSKYEAEPFVFPVSWMPSWPQLLHVHSASVLQGLQTLLSGIVEVDAFELHYKGKLALHDDILENCSLESCKESLNVKHAASEHARYLENAYDVICHREHPEKSDDMDKNHSASRNRWDENLTLTDGLFFIRSAVRREYHPIPHSCSRLVDFGTFVEELNHALHHKNNKLWYLTWRGIPRADESENLSAPEQFNFFIKNLFDPTISPPFVSGKEIVQRNLWLGAIVTSRLHFDALDNIHLCVSGKKIFHLYPASALPYLYSKPCKEGVTNNFASVESIFLLDRLKFAKLFQHVRCWRAEVKTGEAIFVPAGWWHEVFTFEATISLNIWFKPTTVARLRPTLMHLNSRHYHKLVMKCLENVCDS